MPFKIVYVPVIDKNKGGDISKMYTCPRTTGCKKALVRTEALLVRTQINTKARFVNILAL